MLHAKLLQVNAAKNFCVKKETLSSCVDLLLFKSTDQTKIFNIMFSAFHLKDNLINLITEPVKFGKFFIL